MAQSIKIGDSFRRTSQAYKAKSYSVVAIFEPDGHQLHAKLVNDACPSEAVTISVRTLNDRRFWDRLDAKSVQAQSPCAALSTYEGRPW